MKSCGIYISFWDWHFSLGIFLRFILAIAHIDNLFLFVAELCPRCGGTTVSLTSHPLKDTWVASNFWILWVKLLWTFVYQLLDENKSFIWGKCPRMQLLGHVVSAFFGFERNCQTLFRSGPCHQCMEDLILPHPSSPAFGETYLITVIQNLFPSLLLFPRVCVC